jgi:RNA polymerase sigma-70 factor, ECF subfamily
MEDQELGDLYRRFGGLIYRRCLRLLGDKAAAQDATQEVFVRLMRHSARLDPAGGYLRWIYKVATNYCLNVLRDEAPLEIRDPARLPDSGLEGPAAAFPDRALGAQVLRRFDEETRSVAVLSLVDGMTQDEVADILGLSRKTVGRKLRRFISDANKYLTRTA